MGRRNPSWNMHGKGVTKRWDQWFSKAIRQRDNNTCRHCLQQAEQMDCAHIYGRATKSTRWDTRNAVCLCRKCHNFFTKEPMAWFYWLEEELGRPHLDELRRIHNAILKTHDDLLAHISDHYRNEYNRMVQSGTTDLRNWRLEDYENDGS